ncbi:hypothetical protein U0355_10990 [Salimicrobium sp. PL1-032A]|uniref:hypothetical protein n=1 Tax=Salimicrobium sp. PL1-032A TaxID=3095364 RepID=UPI0032608001
MNSRRNVAKDIASLHFNWAGWFLMIIITIYAVFKWGILPIYLEGENFFQFSYQSAKIFSLVIGIISGGTMFAPYIRHGLTRKTAYAGNVIAAFVITACLTATISMITAVEVIVSDSTLFPSPWFFAVLSMFIHLSINFMTGWLITSGYLRFGGIGMTGFILLALFITITNDSILNINSGQAPIFLTDTLASSTGLSILFGAGMLALLVLLGKMTTRHMPIKLK